MKDDWVTPHEDDWVTPPTQTSAEAKEKTPSVSQGEAAVEGALSGASAGWRDEIYGASEASGLPKILGGFRAPVGAARMGIESLSGNPGGAWKTYETARDEKRKIQKAAQEEHPWTYGISEVVGGASIPTGKVLQGANLPQRVWKGMKVGAAYGLAEGLGRGEGLEDTAKQGAVGTFLGTGVGAIAPVALKGVEAGVEKALSPFRGARDPEKEAMRRFGNAYANDVNSGQTGLSPAEFTKALSDGSPVGAVDLGGSSVRALERSSANVSPSARGVLEKFVNERAETSSERLSDAVRDLVTTPADAGLTRETLHGVGRVVNSPFYKKAYQDGSTGILDAELQEMSKAPLMRTVMKEAVDSLENKRASGRAIEPLGPNGPTLEFWDQVKRNLDSKYNVLKRSGDTEAAADVDSMRKSLIGKLDQATIDPATGISSYKTARGVASEFFKATNALEAGEKFASSLMGSKQKFTNHEFDRLWSKMHAEERDLFREGIASELTKRIDSSDQRRSIVNKLFNNETAKRNIETIFGPQKAKELEAAKRLEIVMGFAKDALGNSTTARQLIELGIAGGAGAYQAGSLNPFSIMSNPEALVKATAVWGLTRGHRALDTRMANRMADFLVSNDPAKIKQAIQMASKNPAVMLSLKNFDPRAIMGALAASPTSLEERADGGKVNHTERVIRTLQRAQ